MSEVTFPLSPRATDLKQRVVRRYLESLSVATDDAIKYSDVVGASGILVRTGAAAATTRQLVGIADRTTITNSNGVSGNPTIDISATYAGQTSITTLGTISTGTWHGSTIDSVYLTNTAVANLSGVNTGDQTTITGNAGSATTVATTQASTNAAHYIAFFESSSNGNQAARLDTDLLYNPSTNTLTVTSINGTIIPSSKTLVVTTDKISALASTSSSELAGVISDETGTGALVFANTPTLVTPLLGTPTSGVLTNCTGYTEANLSTSDITTNNSSTSKHGFLKKLDNDPVHFMNGQGDWTRAGDMVLISTATASSSTSITFTGLSSSYSAYMIVIANVIPGTDSTNLYIRTSTNGGSSYDSGATDYKFSNIFIGADATPSYTGSTVSGAAQIDISGNIGNDSLENYCGIVHVIRPSAVAPCTLTYGGNKTSSAGNFFTITGTGVRYTSADVDAIQFLMSSGNIGSGTFYLYGARAA